MRTGQGVQKVALPLTFTWAGSHVASVRTDTGAEGCAPAGLLTAVKPLFVLLRRDDLPTVIGVAHIPRAGTALSAG